MHKKEYSDCAKFVASVASYTFSPLLGRVDHYEYVHANVLRKCVSVGMGVDLLLSNKKD